MNLSPKKMGEAIREALDKPMRHPERARPPGDSEAPLFNDNRRRLYFDAFVVPGAPLRKCQRRNGLDVATTKWNLDVLTKKGFFISEKVGKYRIFGPAGILKTYVPLSTLHVPYASEIMKEIDVSDGKKISVLAEAVGTSPPNLYQKIRNLEEAGFLEKKGMLVKKTEKVKQLSEEWKSKVDAFVPELKKSFVAQGILATVEKKGTKYFFQLDLGVKKEVRVIDGRNIDDLLGITRL